MSLNSSLSLRLALNAKRESSDSFVFGEKTKAAWSELATGSCFDPHGGDLRGRSVLIATTDQFKTSAALVELDGAASRIVLFPPDLALEHVPFVASAARVDTIVSDRISCDFQSLAVQSFIHCGGTIVPRIPDGDRQQQTEWVLLTSGTTGQPKLVVHTLSSLTGAIQRDHLASGDIVWSTFYDIRRYGGLQIFLRAALTGKSLVLSSAGESTSDFLLRAGAHGVTHISGTPSHWRRAAMSSSARLITPDYVRLSGEIADQAILYNLRALYPQATIAHAFATTEAGLVFEVNDGLMGVPADLVQHTPDVEMKIESHSLRVRSNRTACCYLGDRLTPLRDEEGFVDTGDVLALRGDRYYFMGRRDGIINVGGYKVYPEEVETVINGHPSVQMSLVRTRKNPITGALVVADVVLKIAPPPAGNETDALRQDILGRCREALSLHKVPAAIYFVSGLALSESGKIIRHDA